MTHKMCTTCTTERRMSFVGVEEDRTKRTKSKRFPGSCRWNIRTERTILRCRIWHVYRDSHLDGWLLSFALTIVISLFEIVGLHPRGFRGASKGLARKQNVRFGGRLLCCFSAWFCAALTYVAIIFFFCATFFLSFWQLKYSKKKEEMRRRRTSSISS